MSSPPPSDPGSLREYFALLARRARDRAAARALRGPRQGSTPAEPSSDARPAPGGGPSEIVEQIPPATSLLWPEGTVGEAAATVAEETAVDLEIPYLVAQIAPKRRFAPLLDRVLRRPLTDEGAICYRQEILADILASPALRRCVQTLAEEAVATSESFRIVREDRPRLFVVAMHLAELKDYVDTVDSLAEVLRAIPELHSPGLRLLRERLGTVTSTERHGTLRSTVGRMLADIRDIRSVTIGVNLDSQLRPVEATLLAVGRRRFLGSRLMDSVLGPGKDSSRRGIADLHSMLAARPGTAMPIAATLFRDLAAILDQLARGMERELGTFADARVDFVTTLKQELVFYAAAVSFADRLSAAGLPVCAPEIRPREERITELAGSYNPNLAFRMLERGADPRTALVRSDALLSDPCRIAVLTGPNNGGKSVFLQAVGLAQLLAQTGMCVPASSARLSVADTILTHYQTQERPDKEVGRLHEEASRLRQTLLTATRHSLVLSSETFSSTGSSEAAYLVADVLRALQRLGARALFSTHLHELAEMVEREPDLADGETRVMNLVALFDEDPLSSGPEGEGRPTYRVVRARPRGKSYARAVARSLGIQYDQLVDSMRRAGKLDGSGPAGGATSA